ncbi:MAG: glutamine--fructose-6-phosphate transaminase (isomerizing) [Eubacteriales bacterium]|nr:glutamine--fructose-6-phosphate transaminase (isomerizing) [Eubacteriales bacterium]
MCGIVGYIGEKSAVDILIEGLSMLEYRGYDSAGVAVYDNGALDVRKKKGRLDMLRQLLEKEPVQGTMGIGHTRWATHGAPSDENSHPHTNGAGTIAVVHNGIIENYSRLKEYLGAKGYSFRSQTDTEVLAHLIDHYYMGDLLSAVQDALRHVEGSYAICVVSKDHPGEIIAARKDSPLVLGSGQGENFVASDVPALLKHTRDVYFLEDYEVARVTREGIDIFDRYGIPVEREVFHVEWDVQAAERGGYPHFMLKEIHEEPKALQDTLSPRINAQGDLNIEGLGLEEEAVRAVRRIVIVACGTASYAGQVGKYVFEKSLRIPVEVDLASEYRYRDPVVQEGDLFLVISQSGETADTLAAMRLAKARGARILAITNVVGSTISREADAVMYTWAGPEIAVASTKAFTTQLLCIELLALHMARIRGSMEQAQWQALFAAVQAIPAKVEAMLEAEDTVKRCAHRHSNVSDAYFLGRNLDYPIAMEGSLKLKEISYIHSEAFAAGELKHGPIALIEEGTLVLAIATQKELYEKMASNIKEVKARGAHVLAMCPGDAALILDLADEVIELEDTQALLTPLISVIPAQLLAYFCSVERGYDVDKPRNLAKSVTVE